MISILDLAKSKGIQPATPTSTGGSSLLQKAQQQLPDPRSQILNHQTANPVSSQSNIGSFVSDPTVIQPPNRNQVTSNIGTGLTNAFGGEGAAALNKGTQVGHTDIKNLLPGLKNPHTYVQTIKDLGNIIKGLGGAAYSDATFIPQAVANLGVGLTKELGGNALDLFTGKNSGPHSALAKGIDTAMANPDKTQGFSDLVEHTLNQIAPFLIAGEGTQDLPNDVNKIPGVETATKIIKDKLPPPPSGDALAGTIAQGKISDIPKIKTALGSIDTKGIKTYSDLSQNLETKISTISDKLDQVLETNPEPKPINDLTIKSKVGSQTINHNYVTDALQQLKDYYTKVNKPVDAAKIDELSTNAQKSGLTIKQVNDLAKEHGKVLNAFNANGELASGLTKQAAENTRTGLKATVRQQFGNPVAEAADHQISSLIDTKDLVDNMSEKVNQLQQKIQTKSFGAKAGALAAKVFDTLSGGTAKGVVNYFIPRGEGLKTLNALDLQSNLSKNLKILSDILDKNTSEADVEAKLQSILDDAESQKSTKPTVKSRK